MTNLLSSSAFKYLKQDFTKSKIFALLFFSLLFHQKVDASHLVGGEIRWVCVESSGKFIFYMDIYRECTGVPFSFTKQNLQILNSSRPDIVMKPDSATFNLYGEGNISPKGITGCQKTCGSDLGATQFFPFVSDPITLNGIPPNNGWVFHWTSCCRPSSVENLSNPGSQGYGLRSIMYSYNGKNVSNCFDSSPDFEEMPAILVCKGYEFIFNHTAFDTDLDSLVFRWAKPLDNSANGSTFSSNPVVYTTGYSYDKPTPGSSIHPNNQTATLDSLTGEIKLAVYSGQDGWQYATCIQVDAYRCDKKIASIFRDIPFIFFECPLLPGTGLYNNAPVARINGVPSSNYSVNVVAGEIIEVPFQSTEFDIVFDDPNDPRTARAQYNALGPSGLMFSNDFTDSNDCKILGLEPCATLTPAPVFDSTSGRFELKGQGGLSTKFKWQTDCKHLRVDSNCTSNANTYNFVMKTYDDFCDVPGIIYPSISITVKRFVPQVRQQGNQLSVEDSSETYKWYYNDTLIPNSDTSTITAISSGKYSVEVVKYGCQSTRTEYNYWHVGMEELETDLKLGIEVFPNPFKRSLTIKFKDHLQSESYNYTLSDMEGRAIKTSISVIEDQKIVLDITEDIPAGAYILTIFNNEERMIKKLIKY